MSSHATVLSELIAPLAVLILLSLSYGWLRRRMPGTGAAPTLLGILFGGVAVAQMNMPITPMEGLIVDLRNVPVALAGAFLGFRGMVIAILIASATRLGIGGVGAPSGVAAIIIAGTNGYLWDCMTRGSSARSPRMLVGLAGMISLHSVAVVLLPLNVAIWFVTNALPWIIGMNLLIVPAVAYLLERERVQMLREGRQRRRVAKRGGAPFLGPEELALEMAQSADSQAYRAGVELLAIKLRRSSVIAMFWGPEAENHVAAALRDRLAQVLPATRIMGRLRDDLVVVCLPCQSPDKLRDLIEQVAVALTSSPVAVPGMAPVPLRLQIDHIRLDHLPTLGAAYDAFGLRQGRRHHARFSSATFLGGRPHVGTARLFDTADRLFDTKRLVDAQKARDIG